MIKRVLLFFAKRSKLLKQIDRQARTIESYQFATASLQAKIIEKQAKISELKTIVYLKKISEGIE